MHREAIMAEFVCISGLAGKNPYLLSSGFHLFLPSSLVVLDPYTSLNEQFGRRLNALLIVSFEK